MLSCMSKSPSRAVSISLPEETFVEMVYNQQANKTGFAICNSGEISMQDTFTHPSEGTLEPVPASNNLIRHGAVVFPEKPEEYKSISTLVNEIDSYLYRYVDVSDHFRKIAAYYVLLTWIYDAFNELPYLRLRGDFGSGKTRALFVIGSICNRAFFASGASTVSPIFHTLDTFRGTLICDEADFRFSDEKSELVKIFNNGNVRGFPVLRTAMNQKREFDPQAFNVYGTKIVAMRKSFDDPALESRFITEEMGQRSLRKDIPINLPDIQKEEAQTLRNKLLMYRFRSVQKAKVNDTLNDPKLSPRLNQILVPLLSIIDEEVVRKDIREAVRSFDDRLYAERAVSPEASVLAILSSIYATGCTAAVPISNIADASAHTKNCTALSPRVVGNVLRTRLRLHTYKSHGVYVLPYTEREKVLELCIRYGVTDRKDADT